MRHSRLAAVLYVTALLGACEQQAPQEEQAAPQSPARDVSGFEAVITDLGGGAYMIEGGGGNITLVTGTDAAIMVDTQYPEFYDRLSAAFAAITDLPIRFGVLSHFHRDHANGSVNFAVHGTIIVAHRNARERLTQQYVNLNGETIYPLPEVGLPKITYSERLTLNVDGQSAMVFHPGPAHTDTDSIIYFPEANVLSTGDIVTTNHFPFLDTQGGSDFDGIIAALDFMLETINDETDIVPGHGQPLNKAGLERYRDIFATVRDAIAALKAEGKSADEVVAAHPTAPYDAEMGGETARAEPFVRAVYELAP